MSNFPGRAALDRWFEIEPHVTGNVWHRIEITPCQVGPSFVHMLRSGAGG